MAVNARGIIIAGGTKERKLILQNIRSNLAESWVNKGYMPTTRHSFAAAAVNGIIYCIGGITTYSYISSSNIHAVNEAYNPATSTWVTKASMPTARRLLAAAVVDGIIYCIGGVTTCPLAGANEAYDPTTDTWTTKQPMPTARSGLAAGVVNGIIYCMGTSGTLMTNEAYDPATDTWTSKASISTVRQGNPSASVVNGKIYCIQGYAATQPPKTANYAYDPATDTWTAKQPMPTARYGFTTGVVDGIIYCIGGDFMDDWPTANEAYDPVTNTWRGKQSMPAARRDLAGVVVDEIIYCMGGTIKGGNTLGTNSAYTADATLKSIGINGNALSGFDREVKWNGESKPANVEFETTGQGILSFPVTGVSGTVTEKIEKEIIITKL